jgi:hypothetical protein
MRYKRLLISMFLILSGGIAMAQNDQHKMSDTQKSQAAKADVYIIDSKKKIADTLTTAMRDTTKLLKSSKKKYCGKRHKKSS